MDERNVQELSQKSQLALSDQFIIEDEDGTKLGTIKDLKKIIANNLVFSNIEQMKATSFAEGELCMTLGYRTEGDGGGAIYRITYAPTLNEDRALVHYLYTSDTLRAVYVYQDSITPEQCGAYGDGIRDDYTAIKKSIDSGYSIKFLSHKKYKINTAIPLKSDLTLDFNGSTLIPSYCDGLSKPVTANEDILKNVTIKNIVLEMEDGSTAINIPHNSLNINIENFEIKNNKLYGIKFGSGVFIKIHNGTIDNTFDGGTISCIGISLEYTQDDIIPVSTYDIKNVNIKNMAPAIRIDAGNKISKVSVSKCQFSADEETTQTFINAVRTISGNIYLDIEDIYAENINYIASINNPTASVSIRNVVANNTSSLIDSIGSNVHISIGDNINMIGNSLTTKKQIVNKLFGILKILNPDIVYSSDRFVEKTTSETNYTGRLIDATSPQIYDTIVLTGSDTISVPYITNKFIDVQTTSDLTNITGGMKGQHLYLISSTNKKITASANIILKSSSIQLGTYDGIELKNKDGKWYQI